MRDAAYSAIGTVKSPASIPMWAGSCLVSINSICSSYLALALLSEVVPTNDRPGSASTAQYGTWAQLQYSTAHARPRAHVARNRDCYFACRHLPVPVNLCLLLVPGYCRPLRRDRRLLSRTWLHVVASNLAALPPRLAGLAYARFTRKYLLSLCRPAPLYQRASGWAPHHPGPFYSRPLPDKRPSETCQPISVTTSCSTAHHTLESRFMTTASSSLAPWFQRRNTALVSDRPVYLTNPLS